MFCIRMVYKGLSQVQDNHSLVELLFYFYIFNFSLREKMSEFQRFFIFLFLCFVYRSPNQLHLKRTLIYLFI